MSDLIKARKGIFIPDITVEMFRNASLEAVEELLVSGEMQDIILPSAEPERLTDDDFETIRLHLNAQKEKLCNQRRWEEAEEYQRIIDRFIAFASADSEIIRCRDCKHWYSDADCGMACELTNMSQPEDGFCNWAERRGASDE